MRELQIIIGIFFLAAVMALSMPVHSQTMTHDDLVEGCRTVFAKRNCDRLVELTNNATVALAEALAIFLEDGIAAGNLALEELLDQLEQGKSIQNERAIRKGFDI